MNQPGDATVLDAPVDILCSYHYFSSIDMANIHSWGTRIIGDSGAYSAHSTGAEIDREDFHAWADKWSDNLFWVGSLDVIGDAEGSKLNWKAAQADGLNLVPTVHFGAEPQALDWYVEQGVDFMGLGGMVPYASEHKKLMRWLLTMFRHARDHHPHLRFHGWGISHPLLVDNLPFWSTDSSGFSGAFRFGHMRLFDPARGRFVSADLDGRSMARHARLLSEHYGVSDWRTVAVSEPRNRREVGRVALRAVQIYAGWLAKRQRVAPPAHTPTPAPRGWRGWLRPLSGAKPTPLRLTIGLIASALVLGSLVLANWVTTDYGFIPVGFGFEATAGTLFAGVMLASRDAVQDALGRGAVVAMILLGTALSFAIASPAIAVAAAVAFGIAELLDFAVYTPLRSRAKIGDRRWATAVIASNVVGAFADTIIFLGIAFGLDAIGPALPGQLVGKLWATIGYLILGFAGAYVVRRIIARRAATA